MKTSVNGATPRPRYAYVAADHISKREWLALGLILVGAIASLSVAVGVIAAVVVSLIRALKG